MYRNHRRAELRRSLLSLLIVAAMTAAVFAANVTGQTFTKVTDPLNPIVTNGNTGTYTSCAWVDYDDDGRIDLFVIGNNGNFLYHNEGSGSFTRDTAAAMVSVTGFCIGTSWADYDNDGDVDCWLSGGVAGLYRNNAGTFNAVPLMDLGTSSINSWSGAWADYDDDSYLDIVLTTPTGFGPPYVRLLHNLGSPDFHFEEMDTSVVQTEGITWATSSNWSDYDLDGDIDVFIGSGPASAFAGVDLICRNMLSETGVGGFTRYLESPLATDQADGQHWSLIDYDNDGDIDGYRSNWGGNIPSERPNNLFRNDSGNYVKITTGAIVTENFASLANVWADFDNDGDLDCFVSNQASRDSYYRNNGNGTFTAITSGTIVGGVIDHWSAAAGDYDDDGDLDLYVAGQGAANRSLLRNDEASGNKWLKLKLTGTLSNRTAVGARISALATIGGQPTWMMREISTQNSFCGHSSTIVHFGLGDATSVDSLIIYWPSGNRFDTAAVSSNQSLDITERGIVLVAADTTIGAAPFDVQFSATASGTVGSYLWDFGDGGNSGDASPTHMYTLPGIYDVSLIATADDGTFDVSRPNYVWIYADTVVGDQLSVHVGDTVRFDIALNNTFDITKIEIPFSYGGTVNLTYDSAVTTGLRTASITTVQLANTDAFNKRATVRLLANTGETIAPGVDPILSLYFRVVGGPAGDTTAITFGPYSTFSLGATIARDGYTLTAMAGYIAIDPCSPGDVNSSGGGVDISDLTYLVAYAFKGGSAPPNLDNANVDGIGPINIADITYLVNYMFKGGPAPVCP